MRFTKMHGIGNDYVYVDAFREKNLGDLPALARKVSDRHFGVGGDGLIVIGPSERADARMRMFNADGSEAEMCGNGLRCVAKYVHDHGIAAKPQLRLETGRDGHVVHVRPELVVEIAFDGVQASSRYPGGVALRFARVKGYRPDKPASEADTIGRVRMYHPRAETDT